MMIEIPAARRIAETRALMVALAIAAKGDWHARPVGPALSKPYSRYYHVEASRLLLVPTSAGLPFSVRLAAGAMRETRSDALVVSCVTAPATGPTFLFALGRWSSSELRWMAPAWPFLSIDGRLWLTPPRIEIGNRAVPLVAGPLRGACAPWASITEQDAGRARAIGWFDRVIDWKREGQG